MGLSRELKVTVKPLEMVSTIKELSKAREHSLD